MPQLPDASDWSALAQLGPLAYECRTVEVLKNPRDFGYVLLAIFSPKPSDQQALALALHWEIPGEVGCYVAVDRYALAANKRSFGWLFVDMQRQLETHVGVPIELVNLRWFTKEAMRAIIAQGTAARP